MNSKHQNTSWGQICLFNLNSNIINHASMYVSSMITTLFIFVKLTRRNLMTSPKNSTITQTQ